MCQNCCLPCSSFQHVSLGQQVLMNKMMFDFYIESTFPRIKKVLKNKRRYNNYQKRALSGSLPLLVALRLQTKEVCNIVPDLISG